MRRTREEALKTRASLVRAARTEFARRGVSQTTMEHIAEAAGVTRGAVYGHFMNKSAVFAAMREAVKLPLFDGIHADLGSAADDPLAGVAAYLQGVMNAIASDRPTREALGIMLFKCEYVGDLERDMRRQESRCRELTGVLEAVYTAARASGHVRADVDPGLAAVETCAFLIGLIRLWLLDGRSAIVRRKIDTLIDAHLDRVRVTASAHGSSEG